MTTYCIVRVWEDGTKKVLRQRLTEEEAQAHCQRAETSSSTTPRRRDAIRWFDQYREEPYVDFWGRAAERRPGLLERGIQEYCANR